MRYRRILMVVACMCLLSSCATTAVADKVNVNTVTNGGVKFSPIAHARTIELLDFIAIYPNLSTETQKTVFTEVTQALANNQNDLKLRIQKGAMLTLPNSEMRNTIAAQPLLQSLLDSDELNESDTSLVMLLLFFTLDHNNQVTNARDEAKKNVVLKLKNKALLQKLNDLKNIEKTMIERNAKTNSNP